MHVSARQVPLPDVSTAAESQVRVESRDLASRNGES
jgi:hypothetical protein